MKLEVQDMLPEHLLSLEREKKILSELDHPLMIKFIEEFTYKNEQWIITDFVSGGTLKDILDK